MTARHQEVAEALRRRILAGEFTVGERLPPERQLSDHYRVSTPTLRDALELLRSEGLVEKFQGRGNFVSRPRERLRFPYGVMPGDLDVTLSAADIKATAELAAHLGRPPDEPLVEYVCLSVRGEQPQGLARIFVPADVAAGTKPSGCAVPWGDDLLNHLARRPDSAMLSSFDQVTARFPSPTEAQSLRISARVPVLAVHRTVSDEEERVVACVHLVLAGDRAEGAFVTHIFRKGAPR
ncbi:GntR family transcriptional regulator [Actinacidiphila guanduensis]|uniref:GntR family transcriptional regulator n=1 Tax=Actinacidiphila guanduensis TaxID=310781 RepID=A0A1G9XUP7_9ACTN|nr:GntR family transcriptional regulator [Actinacidiphila guanduensis]SDM99895.1 GntR family transcriptional regulator [Actinacidiphila guanduensis]